ncbi:related to Nicotinamidase [Hanseniaspora guilliermondii]|uniref:nicotinamidase n=1 Tax=Hanseniaspora guilliermondii TaxID=56406 RepID=A0A1L0B2H2_9ASCO|nr:related to Nicotinamidase [Hanseniaspora guilliermondii]
MSQSKKCLLIIDMQYDFINGSLKVDEAEQIIPSIRNLINSEQMKFDLIVFTKDDHPRDHISFASNHRDKKPFSEYTYTSESNDNNNFKSLLWPDHCVVGTKGNEIHEDLLKEITDNKINGVETLVVEKGTQSNREFFSCFDDVLNEEHTDLERTLKSKNIQDVYICGLAYDYCVYNSALSSSTLGFKTFIIDNMCKKIDKNWELDNNNIEKITL